MSANGRRDLLLAYEHPNLTVRPFDTPSLQNSSSAAKFLDGLATWHSSLQRFTDLVDADVGSRPDTSPSSGGTVAGIATPSTSAPNLLARPSVESLISVLHLSDIEEDDTFTSKVFRNVQAMAAGLMWVLEVRTANSTLWPVDAKSGQVGTENAPAINSSGGDLSGSLGPEMSQRGSQRDGRRSRKPNNRQPHHTGRIILRPFDPIQTRYTNSNTNDSDLERLKKLGTAEKFLRPLSYMINISPTLVFVDLDLPRFHVDLVAQQQVRHYLATSHSNVAALRYMEDCLLTFIRTICTKRTPARDVILAHFPTLSKDMPALSPADQGIFKDLRTRMQNDHRRQRNRAVSAAVTLPVHPAVNGVALADYLIRPPVISMDLSIVQCTNSIAHGLSLVPCGLSPLTAFTKPLQVTVVPQVAVIRPEMPIPAVAAGSAEAAAVPGQTLSVIEPNSQSVDDELNSVEPSSPRPDSPAPVEHALDGRRGESPMHADVADAGPQRRSTRSMTALSLKRKSPPLPSRPAASKKSKSQTQASVQDVEEDLDPQGLDSDWSDPKGRNRWYHDLAAVANIERSKKPARISGLLPDGRTQQDFDYIGHLASEDIEYKLIYDVTTSMDSVRKRCSQNGVFYTQFNLGDVVESLTINDSHLLCMQYPTWQATPALARVSLWGTGRDLFVHGLTAGPKVVDVRSELTKGHRMDTPIEVQGTSICSFQGLRIPPKSDDADAEVDYTASIRTTTLDTMLDHEARLDGLVLNALNLPSGHFVRPNPLLGTGFDLEIMVYSQTNGLVGFRSTYPSYKETYFQLFGLAHCLSILHADITATWIYVMGPAEKFWVRSRPKYGQDDIMHSHAFDDWDPDQANLDTHEYEQPGRRHTVIGAGSTVTTGGMRPAMGVILHMVMLQHVLTNAGHVTMWPIFIRVSMFWLTSSMSKNSTVRTSLAEYLPDLSLNHARGYQGSGVPADLLSLDSSGGTLRQYHLRVYPNACTTDVYKHFTPPKFQSGLVAALTAYDSTRAGVNAYRKMLREKSPKTKFLLFEGDEFRLVPL
ncbi:hypothetical protein DFH06DRAFT_1151586 [Mycena polygramma]|nr:hypothetical protein DFH06DRAFT_1151586 [Mycena polygramma]